MPVRSALWMARVAALMVASASYHRWWRSWAVAVRPARSALACHRRAAAAVSQAALAEVLGLRLAKYRPVMPSTWGEEAR
jgi:hypothetical protein